MVCLPVREIILLLKLVGYHLVQADKPWYNYYLTDIPCQKSQTLGMKYFILCMVNTDEGVIK